MNTSTKQLTELANIKVTMNRTPRANFKVVHTQFIFAQLKTTLNRKTRKNYPQEPRERHARRTYQTIPCKIFDLTGIQYVSGDYQRMSGTGREEHGVSPSYR